MQLGIGVNLFKRRREEGLPVRDGLIVEYRFDEGRGQLLCDYSGNKKHGRLGSTWNIDTNDPLWVPEGLQFDGVDDYVETTFTTVTENYTIGFLVYMGITNNNTFFLTNRVTMTNESVSVMRLINNGAIALDFGGVRWTTDYILPQEKWVHFCLVRTVSGTKLYVGGILHSSSKLAGDRALAQTGENFVIGSDSGASSFKGIFGDARIYNRALTPSEVLQNYEWSKTELAKRGVNLE